MAEIVYPVKGKGLTRPFVLHAQGMDGVGVGLFHLFEKKQRGGEIAKKKKNGGSDFCLCRKVRPYSAIPFISSVVKEIKKIEKTGQTEKKDNGMLRPDETDLQHGP